MIVCVVDGNLGNGFSVALAWPPKTSAEKVPVLLRRMADFIESEWNLQRLAKEQADRIASYMLSEAMNASEKCKQIASHDPH